MTGQAIRYVDWLFPGMLGMNMMFSCLFGVGYVVLRYRKSGFLKRLHATPLSAFEFLTAQVLSRLGLILTVTTILYVGIGAIIHFHRGEHRPSGPPGGPGRAFDDCPWPDHRRAILSEELVGGLLNVLTWPMMLLSGVWYLAGGVAPVDATCSPRHSRSRTCWMPRGPWRSMAPDSCRSCRRSCTWPSPR